MRQLPTIAMINGWCLGGGCELALACDLRMGADTAMLGQPEIRLGIIPGGGATQRLPRLVGYGKALQLILSGEPIDGVSAYEIGLLDEVVPAAELRERTMEVARTIAEKSPVTLGIAKRAIRAAYELPLSAGLEQERDLFALAFATEDKIEGVAAFLEKRKPEWRGRVARNLARRTRWKSTQGTSEADGAPVGTLGVGEHARRRARAERDVRGRPRASSLADSPARHHGPHADHVVLNDAPLHGNAARGGDGA